VFDPALANPRQKRKIIYDAKKESAPCGTGLEGKLLMEKKSLQAGNFSA
jgi:hypothetical protein